MLAAALLLSHWVFEFWTCVWGGGDLPRCLFTVEQSCHPPLLLLFYLRHSWDSGAHLGLVIGSDFSLFKIAKHPAKISERVYNFVYQQDSSTLKAFF